MTFEELPNKKKRTDPLENECLWPEFGQLFELNAFYRKYQSSEGDIGEGYIKLWTVEEIKEYETISADMFDRENKVFGGDGGGTYFGFKRGENGILFFSFDPIDLEGSINILGTWLEFICCLKEGDY